MDRIKKIISTAAVFICIAAFAWILFNDTPKAPIETYAGLTRTPTPTPTDTPTPTPRVTEIVAEWQGDPVPIGTEINTSKLFVYAIYTDGSSKRVFDYDLLTKEVSKIGENRVYVRYQGRSAYVIIEGREQLKVKSLEATYTGGGVIVGNEIKKDDITVYAVYNWEEKEPLLLKSTTFAISPATVTKQGDNKITVTYGDVRTTVIVEGLERVAVPATCEYKGKGVFVGSRVTISDFAFKVKYNDGKEEALEKFTIVNPRIMGEGENIVTVMWQDFSFDVSVPGIPKEDLAGKFAGIPDYDTTTMLVMVVSHDQRVKTLSASLLDRDKIKEAVEKVVVCGKYVGFEVSYTDPEAILEFPILARVTRPDDYDADKFGVYWTPNRKTIMARINGEYIDDEKKYYAFYIYEPGSYAILEEISSKLVTSINLPENSIVMKRDRNYSIETDIRPLSAENKALRYWSTDDTIAAVTENGKVYSMEAGECDIYVEATDGSGVYAVLHVTVKEK